MIKYTLKSDSIDFKSKVDFNKELNPEQLEVVLNGDGPCLVLAGAGSGKTRTLVYRVVYLLERGVPASSIMLVTFTNKAAREMLERINVILGTDAKGLWGGTFHHIGNRLLRIYGERIGLANNFTILDEEDSLTLIKNAISQSSAPQDKYFPKSRVIRSIISLGVNLCRDIDEVIDLKYDNFRPEYKKYIIEAAKIYVERKKQINALDFDDLLVKWNELMESDVSLRANLGRKFAYILVDEYQDTNYLQSRLINNLASPQNNVLVVGDDSQSIYGFRGADVNNILDFPQSFEDAKIFHLNTNYRSTPEILGLANHSINRNEKKFEKHLTAVRPSGQKPALLAATDNYQQAEFIAQMILDLQRENGYNLSETSVLFRSHFQSLELEMELNKRGIPYQMRGGLRFFEQAHLKDVTAYLRILNNLKDEVAWLRLLMMQGGIGEATADKIFQWISQQTAMQNVIPREPQGDRGDPVVLKLGAKAASGWKNLSQTLARLAELDKNDLPALVETVLATGYEDYLKANFENFSERLEDLQQLEAFIAGYDNLEKFLSDTALAENFKGESREAEAGEDLGEELILSTIHQAKGLEWRAVFVIGLADGLFPHAKVYGKPEELEEERRLFYVAVTRAKEQLYLTYPLFNQDNILRPSQFIKELHSKFYERWDLEEDFSSPLRPARNASHSVAGGKGRLGGVSDNEIKYVDEDEEFNPKPAKRRIMDFDPRLDF